MSTSPRRSEGRFDNFQNRPSSSGNADTAWLPVDSVITRPFVRRRSWRFSTSSTLGRSPRCPTTPFSSTNVSSPISKASNVRSRPIDTVVTVPERLAPSVFTRFSNWRMADMGEKLELFLCQKVFCQRADRIEVRLVRRREKVPQRRDDMLAELGLAD